MAGRSRDSKGNPRKDPKGPDGRPLTAKGKRRPGYQPKAIGRRSKIHEPGLAEDVIERLKRGHTIADAAQGAGISRAAFLEWRRRGEEALQEATGEGQIVGDVDISEILPGVEERERPYVVFAVGVARATATARGRLHDIVMTLALKAQSKDPREQAHALKAATWMLERRWPETYGRADRLELTGNEDRPVALQIFAPVLQRPDESDEELMARSRGSLPEGGGDRSS